MWNLTDTQLTIIVVAVLIVLFVVGGCKLTCQNSKEGYCSRRFTGPTVAYPDKGGNMLQGWVRENARIVGEDSCDLCLKTNMGYGMSADDACTMCEGMGHCMEKECGCN